MLEYAIAIIKILVAISAIVLIPVVLLIRFFDNSMLKHQKKENNQTNLERERNELSSEIKLIYFPCEKCGRDTRLYDKYCRYCGAVLDEPQLMRHLLKTRPPKPYDPV